MQEKILYNYNRRFGLEIEINSLDNRDFTINKLNKYEYPQGTIELAEIIRKNLNKSVDISGYKLTHNNVNWNIKPDSSCGIEVCTPVSSIREHYFDIFTFLKKAKEAKFNTDKRCSVHVNINLIDGFVKTESTLSDRKKYEWFPDSRCVAGVGIYNLLKNWIRFEHIFFDLMPSHRKNTKYARCIGLTPRIDIEKKERIEFNELFSLFSYDKYAKYCSANIYHLCKGSRPTIEFRLFEGSLNPVDIINWTRLLIFFVDKSMEYTSLSTSCKTFVWADLKTFFKLMDFDKPDLLSIEMQQCRSWFIYTLNKNLTNSDSIFWSKDSRSHILNELNEIIDDEKIKCITIEDCYNSLLNMD